MRRFWIVNLTTVFFLTSCGVFQGGQNPSGCGNGVCDNGENSLTCRVDCPTLTFSGRIQTTHIKTEGSTPDSTIDIAVMVASPQQKRYTAGAGVVVVVPPLFADPGGFMREPDLSSLGLVQVSFVWPGQQDEETGAKSEGDFDHGGPNSIGVLRDVIRFAGGRLADTDGRYIFGLTSVPPLTEEVGLYAFGDAGLAAVKALSLYGDQFLGLQYYIGRENPTNDILAAHEIGYYNDVEEPLQNPFYKYPESYSFDQLSLVYTNPRWDPTFTSIRSEFAGRPFLDLDGNGAAGSADFIFDGQIPQIGGKRYYSSGLLQALIDSGALAESAWPADLATPQESAQFWQYLQNPDRFALMQTEIAIRNLKVMLVFGQEDHSQVVADKPHIHQAYQGFRFQAKFWVRLNPDRAYMQEVMQETINRDQGVPVATVTASPLLDFPDNPANTQPQDWANIGEYAYPTQRAAAQFISLAAVAEMADRAHARFWDENLGQSLYIYPLESPNP